MKRTANKRKSPSKSLILDKEYIEIVRQNSYLGKKGYTILKSILSVEDLDFLKTDLYLKPEVVGVSYGPPGAKDEGAFPVYRENDKKIYLPRFYGIQRYGLTDKSELEPGMDIDVPFVKSLRDYQEDIVNKYMNFVDQPLSKKSQQHASGGILQVFTGAGKTVMAIKLITLLKKKTMILVHKEFLMNQWIERIQEYAPQARIGKIQAQIYDVDDKDIVIAMIQTMYNRTFPESTYTQFGFTIIDEVHRIGSEEFSKTLLKTITPFMLGISATVERKDKLTKLLYMFIGPLIYSTEKPPDDPVFVRGIEFKTNDPEFNETELDFRGKPKFSTMISKLCNYGARKDFLVRVTQDLCIENPESQIMILAHNRSLLTYLYEAINHRKFATVGYYVGGMKPDQLKETEGKNIVLATYAMAAEALDIKSLSILMLATPKTDIVQSVGRILRMKHERPIVVDIVDCHDIFQNQWARRKTYYRKCNYRIRSINSVEYQGFELNWEKDTTWRRVFEPKKNQDVVALSATSEQVTDDSEPETPTTIFKGKCMIADLAF